MARFVPSHLRIGLDIGATAVRAAELRGNPPALARVAQVRLPAGAFENGEVKDAGAVASALQELWRLGHYRGRHVMLAIGNQRVIVREITLPWLAEKELRTALPFQVQEQVPIPIAEAVLDYEVLEELEQDGRRMVRILLVAAHKVMIYRLVEAVQMAKLVPIGIDIVPFAIIRSAGSTDGLGISEAPGDEAVIDIGSDITSIAVHMNGVPRFVRLLPSGGRDITEAISRSLAVPSDEAERLKRGESTEQDEMRKQAEDVINARVHSFVDEVRSSLDFYSAQSPTTQIVRAVVTGGGSKTPGLIETLADQLPFEVAPGHAFRRVSPSADMIPEAMASAEPLLAVAVGLAMSGARR